MSVIPKQLERGFLGGYSPATARIVLGEPEFNMPALRDGDGRRARVVTAMTELDAVYGRDYLSCHPVCYGIMEGVLFMRRMMSCFAYNEALAQVFNALRRLSEIDRIECVFLSHQSFDQRSQPLNQNGEPVSEGEAFCYGVREGLRYAVKLVGRLDPSSATEPTGYLQLPEFFQLSGSMRDSQIAFVKHTLPKLRALVFDRPSFYDVNLAGHGWSRAGDLLERLSGSAKNAVRYTATPQYAESLIASLRANTLLFHIFRLGFGRFNMRPRLNNKVFQRTAEDVPLADVQELFDLHKAAGATPAPATWLN